MRSLLTAIAIVAALCLVSIAAPGQEDPFGTPRPPQDTPKADDVFGAPRNTPDEDASNEELRQEYLRILEERSRDMSKAELQAAINGTKAERHWNDAAAKLTEAAKELLEIHKQYPGTPHATRAYAIVRVLDAHGVNTGLPENPRGRPRPATDDPFRSSTNPIGPSSQVPASRRQAR